MTIAEAALTSGANPARAAELLALAVRVRNFAPALQTEIYLAGQLAGPDTWQGRVADVFWQEMLDHALDLGRMGDQLDLVARRLEAQAGVLAGPPASPTGAGG